MRRAFRILDAQTEKQKFANEKIETGAKIPHNLARGALLCMSSVYRFHPYKADVCAGELLKHGLRLKLAPQLCQILSILLERAGEIVTREDLKHRLWPAEPPSDFELSLNKAMNKLRQVLSDKADKPRYIETLPRQGYRFIGKLEAEANQENGRTGYLQPSAQA